MPSIFSIRSTRRGGISSALPCDVRTVIRRARIASGDVFVESGAHAKRLREALDVHLVDMETAAVAHAASLLGLPWVAVKACTDEADGQSAGDFMENLRSAARKAALAAEEIIAGL